jgi:hypothetical protein
MEAFTFFPPKICRANLHSKFQSNSSKASQVRWKGKFDAAILGQDHARSIPTLQVHAGFCGV